MVEGQEGDGCGTVKLGSLAGAVGMKSRHLHSQHGENSGENLSPRSPLEFRALSGLAIAIDLDEKKNKPLHTQDHVVLGRFCCEGKKHHVGCSGQQANPQQDLLPRSSLSKERLTYMIHRDREATSDAPIVGLRMVPSLYPMLCLSINTPAAKKVENLVMGRSVSRERMLMVAVADGDEQRKASCVFASVGGERKQGMLSERGLKVSVVGSPPCHNVKKLRHSSPKSMKSGVYRQDHQGFLAGRSTIESSIFYYVDSSSLDMSHLVTTAAVPLADDDVLDLSAHVEDFLKICFFCKSQLGVGKDIYMYRGDQAFCSAECRYQQITIDECQGLTAQSNTGDTCSEDTLSKLTSIQNI